MISAATKVVLWLPSVKGVKAMSEWIRAAILLHISGKSSIPLREKKREQAGLQGDGIDNAMHAAGLVDHQLMDQD